MMILKHIYAFNGLLLSAAASSPLSCDDHNESTIPLGTPIRSCTVPGAVALTFDDGPYIYTEQVLDTLAAAGIKATFFVNGHNLGDIYDYATTIQRMVNDGHQVGSHTYVTDTKFNEASVATDHCSENSWSHHDLANLSYEEVATEIT
jgi:hypothetical protein